MRKRIALTLLVALVGATLLTLGNSSTGATSSTLAPVADSYVQADKPGTNFGTATSIKVDGSPVTVSYLRFEVKGLGAPVAKATLTVFTPTAASTSINVRPVADNGWSEVGLTYTNRPPAGATAIPSALPIVANTTLSYNVTRLVSGDGLYSFALDTSSSNSKSLPSRENATESQRPKLIIETGPTPTPTATATATGPPAPTGTPTPPPTTPGQGGVVAAAGDIACVPGQIVGSSCQHGVVSDAILADTAIDTVLALGDNQYDAGTLTEYQGSYDQTWGRFKGKTRPVPGNHEYSTANAAGYYGYFGPLAGDATKGYYSFDVGAWHFIAMNSEKDYSPTGAQMAWLRSDLAAHPSKCVAAYWHRPRWSTGNNGDSTRMAPAVQILYDANADLILSGHDHDYERFQPLNPSGIRDDARGIVSIVSGSGGRSHYMPVGRDTTVTMDRTSYGYSRLVLHEDSAEVSFVPAVGIYADSFTLTCH
jgi:hypothetical protein